MRYWKTVLKMLFFFSVVFCMFPTICVNPRCRKLLQNKLGRLITSLKIFPLKPMKITRWPGVHYQELPSSILTFWVSTPIPYLFIFRSTSHMEVSAFFFSKIANHKVMAESEDSWLFFWMLCGRQLLFAVKLKNSRRYHSSNKHAVANPSAIEGQTANFLNSRTGLWARCLTSLLEFQKHLMSLLAETKRRVIPATKLKFFNNKTSEKRLESWEQIAGLGGRGGREGWI